MQKLSLEEQLDFIRENPSDVGKIENLLWSCKARPCDSTGRTE